MSMNHSAELGGGGRIRTHGEGLPHNGFQDRRLKPLGHSSVERSIAEDRVYNVRHIKRQEQSVLQAF